MIHYQILPRNNVLLNILLNLTIIINLSINEVYFPEEINTLHMAFHKDKLLDRYCLSFENYFTRASLLLFDNQVV